MADEETRRQQAEFEAQKEELRKLQELQAQQQAELQRKEKELNARLEALRLSEEAAGRKQQEEEVEKKQQEEEVERKKREEEAEKKKREEEAERKQRQEEAERQQRQEEAERKQRQEEAERKQRQDEAERKQWEEEQFRREEQDALLAPVDQEQHEVPQRKQRKEEPHGCEEQQMEWAHAEEVSIRKEQRRVEAAGREQRQEEHRLYIKRKIQTEEGYDEEDDSVLHHKAYSNAFQRALKGTESTFAKNPLLEIELFTMVRAGREEDVCRLLASRANPNVEHVNGQSALLAAIKSPTNPETRTAIVALLMCASANPGKQAALAAQDVDDPILLELVDEPVEKKELDSSYFQYHRNNEWREARQALLSAKFQLKEATMDLNMFKGQASLKDMASNDATTRASSDWERTPKEEEAAFDSAFCFNLDAHQKSLKTGGFNHLTPYLN